MKRSISLYKKLPLIKSLSVFFLFTTLSCALKDDSSPSGTQKAFGFFNLKYGNMYGDVECLNLKSTLDSQIGLVPIRLYIDVEKNTSVLQIDDKQFEFPATNAPTNICKGDPTTMAYFAKLLERSVPSCHIEMTKKGFACSLSYASSSKNLEYIRAVKLALLRQGKRVPYLLSRRLTLTENLGEILEDDNWQEGLKAFCGVMQASLEGEKPLILSSPQWREALCKKKSDEKSKRETALIVLTKSVEEITFMYMLQDKVNLPGNLRVHVQNDMLPASGKVWVKLEASNTTMSNILTAAHTVRATDIDSIFNKASKKSRKKKSKKEEVVEEKVPALLPRACWFPGFTMKESLFASGRDIKLWGNREDAPCIQAETKQELDSVARYFMETISAETTFELSESNSKLLSLPAGPYHYSVYEYPDKLGVNLEKNLVDQGLIVWNGKHQGLKVAKAK